MPTSSNPFISQNNIGNKRQNEKQMTEDTNEIFRKIKERVNSIGWDIVYKGCETPGKPLWVKEHSRLYLKVLSKDGSDRNLLLDVTIYPNRYMVSFPENDGKNHNRKICNDPKEMLDFIVAYLT